MSATARVREWDRASATRRAATLAPPALKRIWLYTRLLDFSHLPPLGRLLAFLYYRVCRQPPALKDEDGVMKFYDIRATYGSRPAAHRQCGDADDAILGIVFGRDYGTPISEADTFCRPRLGKYRRKDSADALLYPEDLEDQIVAEAAEQRGLILRAARELRQTIDHV